MDCKDMQQGKIDEKFNIAMSNLRRKCNEGGGGAGKRACEMIDGLEDQTIARLLFHDLCKEGLLDIKEIKLKW